MYRRPLKLSIADQVKAAVEVDWQAMLRELISRARFVAREGNLVPYPQHVHEGVSSVDLEQNLIMLQASRIARGQDHAGQYKVMQDGKEKRILTTETMVETVYSEFACFAGPRFRDFAFDFSQKYTGYRKDDLKPLTDSILKHDLDIQSPATILSTGGEGFGYQAVYEKGKVLVPGKNGQTKSSINRKAAELDRVKKAALDVSQAEKAETSYDSDESYGSDFFSRGHDDAEVMAELDRIDGGRAQALYQYNQEMVIDSNGRWVMLKDQPSSAPPGTRPTSGTVTGAKASGTYDRPTVVDSNSDDEKDAAKLSDEIESKATGYSNGKLPITKALLEQPIDALRTALCSLTAEQLHELLAGAAPTAPVYARRDMVNAIVKNSASGQSLKRGPSDSRGKQKGNAPKGGKTIPSS